jgi:hypothetical protein
MTQAELVKLIHEQSAFAFEEYEALLQSAPGQDIHALAIRTVAEATAIRAFEACARQFVSPVVLLVG